MTGPVRIQLRRTKGWRKPAGAIVVSRPTKWGNPYVIIASDRRLAVELYLRGWIQYLEISPARAIAELDELRGHDLCCWCPLDQPCHADVLLELANA